MSVGKVEKVTLFEVNNQVDLSLWFQIHLRNQIWFQIYSQKFALQRGS
jgi:hypothetical protein